MTSRFRRDISRSAPACSVATRSRFEHQFGHVSIPLTWQRVRLSISKSIWYTNDQYLEGVLITEILSTRFWMLLLSIVRYDRGLSQFLSWCSRSWCAALEMPIAFHEASIAIPRHIDATLPKVEYISTSGSIHAAKGNLKQSQSHVKVNLMHEYV